MMLVFSRIGTRDLSVDSTRVRGYCSVVLHGLPGPCGPVDGDTERETNTRENANLRAITRLSRLILVHIGERRRQGVRMEKR